MKSSFYDKYTYDLWAAHQATLYLFTCVCMCVDIFRYIYIYIYKY